MLEGDKKTVSPEEFADKAYKNFLIDLSDPNCKDYTVEDVVDLGHRNLDSLTLKTLEKRISRLTAEQKSFFKRLKGLPKEEQRSRCEVEYYRYVRERKSNKLS